MDHYVDLRSLRKELTELLVLVRRNGDRIIITRRGEPTAAIISIEDLEALTGQLLIHPTHGPKEEGDKEKPDAAKVDEE